MMNGKISSFAVVYLVYTLNYATAIPTQIRYDDQYTSVSYLPSWRRLHESWAEQIPGARYNNDDSESAGDTIYDGDDIEFDTIEEREGDEKRDFIRDWVEDLDGFNGDPSEILNEQKQKLSVTMGTPQDNAEEVGDIDTHAKKRQHLKAGPWSRTDRGHVRNSDKGTYDGKFRESDFLNRKIGGFDMEDGHNPDRRSRHNRRQDSEESLDDGEFVDTSQIDTMDTVAGPGVLGNCGAAVAVSYSGGDILAVGCPTRSIDGVDNAGAVEIFRRSSTTDGPIPGYDAFQLIDLGDLDSLIPGVLQTDVFFGNHVALSDNGLRLVVSAEGLDKPAGAVDGVGASEVNNGALFVFSRRSADDAFDGDVVLYGPEGLLIGGRGIALSGDGGVLIAGAIDQSSNSAETSQAIANLGGLLVVTLGDFLSGQFRDQPRLLSVTDNGGVEPNNGLDLSNGGGSYVISGRNAISPSGEYILGCILSETATLSTTTTIQNAGACYLYRDSNHSNRNGLSNGATYTTNYTLVRRFETPYPTNSGAFGASIALTDDTFAITPLFEAIDENGSTILYTGEVYIGVLDRDAGGFTTDVTVSLPTVSVPEQTAENSALEFITDLVLSRSGTVLLAGSPRQLLDPLQNSFPFELGPGEVFIASRSGGASSAGEDFVIEANSLSSASADDGAFLGESFALAMEKEAQSTESYILCVGAPRTNILNGTFPTLLAEDEGDDGTQDLGEGRTYAFSLDYDENEGGAGDDTSTGGEGDTRTCADSPCGGEGGNCEDVPDPQEGEQQYVCTACGEGLTLIGTLCSDASGGDLDAPDGGSAGSDNAGGNGGGGDGGDGDSSSSSSSVALIAGVVAGAVVLVAAIAGYVVHKRRKSRAGETQTQFVAIPSFTGSNAGAKGASSTKGSGGELESGIDPANYVTPNSQIVDVSDSGDGSAASRPLPPIGAAAAVGAAGVAVGATARSRTSDGDTAYSGTIYSEPTTDRMVPGTGGALSAQENVYSEVTPPPSNVSSSLAGAAALAQAEALRRSEMQHEEQRRKNLRQRRSVYQQDESEVVGSPSDENYIEVVGAEGHNAGGADGSSKQGTSDTGNEGDNGETDGPPPVEAAMRANSASAEFQTTDYYE
eukprot:Clim_evm5s50 gene=Clim_evmTU5s50